MNCFVYRSNRQKGMFLYLVDKGDFSNVPESLMTLLGETTFSFEFDLAHERKLVRAEAKEVIRNMNENGYFLQMPPAKDELLGQRAN